MLVHFDDLEFCCSRSGLETAQNEFLKEITNGTPNKKRLSGLVDKLISEPVKFNESSIGGGPWQVIPQKEFISPESGAY